MGLYKEHFKHLIEESNATQYKYACVYVEFNDTNRKPFVDFVNMIPAEDINEEEGGREKDSHITVLYGLKDGANKVVPKLHNLLKPIHQISVTLGKVTSFENERFDVLKVDVISADLNKINRIIRDNFEVHSDFPDYHPHVTLAYLKKGTAKKYVGSDKFQGKQFIFKNMIFSDKRGEATDKIVKIPLNEDLGYGGGMPSGQAMISGQTGTFSSPRPVNTTVSTYSPQSGNTIINYGAYETINDDDLNVPEIDKDELRMGMRREMSKQKFPDKDVSKRIAVANLQKDPKYYSALKMYNENFIKYLDKCKNCGKPKFTHNTTTKACPTGQQHPTQGYTQYSTTTKFEPMDNSTLNEIMNKNNESEYDQEGGDITTEDGNTWYQYGKLYHTGDEASLKRKIDKDQFWPNIFQVSDHGNFHQITLNESLKDIENWLNESVSPNEALNRKFQQVELRLIDVGNPYRRWKVELVPNQDIIRVWADSRTDIPGIKQNMESTDVMASALMKVIKDPDLVVVNKGVSFGEYPNVNVDLKLKDSTVSDPKQSLNEGVVWNRPLTVKGKAVKINMEAIGDIIRGEQDKRKSKKLINLRDAMNVVTPQPQPKTLL